VTRYTLATLDQWAAKTIKRADLVVKASTNDTIVMASKTAVGTSRGGSVRRGFVPRKDGILAASLVSELQGSTVLSAQGEDSYRLAIAGMEAGDVARFGWTAPYARVKHDGGRGQPGWFWIDEAANRWPQIVDAAVQRAKARTGG
jgi:hypothetical protein